MNETQLHNKHRTNSVKLRKRKDQAKKDFLKDRRSGDFGYKSHTDGWSYVSFLDTPRMMQTNALRPNGYTDMSLNNDVSARSLGYITHIDKDDQCNEHYSYKTRHNNPLLSPHHRTAVQVMSDTEDCARIRRKKSRRTDVMKDTNVWRRSAIELGELDHAKEIIYKDFGLIDSPSCLENISPIQTRMYRDYPVQTREIRDQEVARFMDLHNQPLSLPVKVREKERQNDQFPLLKGEVWQKRRRIFSKWKERYCVLTPRYLHCYSKCPTSYGDASLVFKTPFSSIEKLDLVEKKGYMTIEIAVHNDGTILLRNSLGIMEWFYVLKDSCKSMLDQSTEQFWSGRLQVEADSNQRWLLGRPGLGYPQVQHPRSTVHLSTQPVQIQHPRSTVHLSTQPVQIQHPRSTVHLSKNPLPNVDTHHSKLYSNTTKQELKQLKSKSSSQRDSKRPNSITKLSDQNILQTNKTKSNIKPCPTRENGKIFQDSGNSSLSTSTLSTRCKKNED